MKETFQHPITLVKSSYIGMLIGAIPGAGGTVSNFIAYGEAMRSSKHSERFGEGEPVGVIATESSNNGTIGGSLIPTISFGIPGSGSTAVLLGGLLMHGLRPGPQLFEADLHLTYTFFLALLIGNFFVIFVGIFLVTRMGRLTTINTHALIPMIVVLSMIGGFALNSNWIDIWTLLVLGVVGYMMVKYDYSIIAFVLGVVLGPIAEENLLRSLQLSEGSYMIFLNPVQQPIAFVLTLITVGILVGPYLKPRLERALS